MAQYRPLAERFWEKVEVRSAEECWLWKASRTRNGNGYGRFNIGKKTAKLAHHVMWFLIHGRWPKRRVLHTCDHPWCMNPSHHFEGTQKDNIHDCIAKGRKVQIAKLSDAEIAAICNEYALAPKQYGMIVALAEKYRTTPQTIKKYVSGHKRSVQVIVDRDSRAFVKHGERSRQTSIDSQRRTI